MSKFVRILSVFSLLVVVMALGSGIANADKPDKEAFVVLRPRDTHAASRLPTGKTNNLSSRGGAVQTATKVYISYWGPEWATGFTTGSYSSDAAKAYVETFFGNVGGSSWIQTDNEYCMNVPSGTTDCSKVSGAVNIANPGSQLQAVWNDPTPVPSKPTQSEIAAAAVRVQQHFNPAGPADPNATFMVFTPTAKSMSGFGTQWCAWHSSTTTANGKIAYAYIPYMPDAGASCGMNFRNANDAFGHGYFDGFSIVAGHEYEEAKSDPFPSSGWLDRFGYENADKCAWNSASGNISLTGGSFAVQPLWSNTKGGCTLTAP
jgi:serine protease